MPETATSRARATTPISAPRIAFNRTKYGRDLLVDVAWVHDMPAFILGAPHSLDFFDLILVTRGRGAFWLDGYRHTVRPGRVFFTTPGQVRRWDVSALDGICLFFTDGFIREFLQDDSFIHRLPFFQGDPRRAALVLHAAAARRFRARFTAMREELSHFRRDSMDLLRAQLHETLITFAREYASAFGVLPQRRSHPVVSRYLELIGRHVARRHRVADYAAELGVTAGHLNVLCGQYAGHGAKQTVDAELVTRARRMLLHTDESAARVGAALGFGDPSYFSRFFRRETGQTPTQFRSASRPRARSDG